jgi:hypothetical protein
MSVRGALRRAWLPFGLALVTLGARTIAQQIAGTVHGRRRS